MQQSVSPKASSNINRLPTPRSTGIIRAQHSWWLQLLALTPGLIFMIDMLLKGSAATEQGRQFSLADDVMISMSYARTLAETGEWVWYPGAPFVEGFTNFLWTLYLTLLHLAGLEGSTASMAVSITGLLIVACLALVMGRWTLLALGTRGVSLVSAMTVTALIPFLYPLTYWTLRGYEVGIIALLAAIAGYGAAQGLSASACAVSMTSWNVVAGTAVATGVLVRMDFLAIALGISAISLVTPAPVAIRIRLAATTALPALTALAAVATFQWLYWGSPTPNTYTLKVEGFTLIERLSRGFMTWGVTLPAIVMGALALLVVFKCTREVAIRTSALIAGSVVVTSVAYNAWTGGDAWEWLLLSNRYLSVILPFVLFLVVASTTAVINNREKLPWYSAGALVLVVALSTLGMGLRVNPFAYTTDNFGSAALLATALLLLTTLGIRLTTVPVLRGAALVTAILSSALALISVSSLGPLGTYWSGQQAQLVGEDLNRIRDGLDLREVTSPDARIAVLPAGSVPYYSERETIDLLGKSDAVIASLAPKSLPPENPMSAFFPGHNKWNYDYSIGELRPDVVYSPNFDFVGFESLEAWGYAPLCSRHNVRSYFLTSSTKINWAELQPC